MAVLPFLHIKSTKFPIMPGETEGLVNEGTYGKALSEYLANHLKKKGYHVPFICCEDWGWWVEIKGQPYSLGCCVYGASDALDRPELCVKISREPEKKWSFLRFRTVDTRDRVHRLFSDLKSIFESDPEVEILGFPDEFPLDD